MKFNHLNSTHMGELQSMVASDRFSTGQSNLDLHVRDQSHHPPCRPEAVIWPVNRQEVSDSPTLFIEFHGTTESQLAEILEIAREICQEQQCSDFRTGQGWQAGVAQII